jgi:predicted dienelactone hydrolase
MRICVASLALAFLLFARSAFGSIGFQEITIPDSHGKEIAVGIWYPSNAQPSAHPLGLFSQNVAADSRVFGEHLPIVLISHGASGNLASHYDTAIALAQAGFVVAALTHTGDNSSDQRYIGNRIDLIERPRQVKVVLDWMLSSWADRSHLDPERVGMFGFSLGGFTTLVEIGGTPELERMMLLCSTHPDAPECAFIKQRHGDGLNPNPAKPIWMHDARIKAAVVAAPAVSFLFGPGDLRQVGIPVQLWRAEKDTQAPDPWNSAIVRKELSKSPEEHTVPGQDHYIFLAPCSDALAAAVRAICHDAAGFDRTAFHQNFNQSVVAFFSRELKSH